MTKDNKENPEIKDEAVKTRFKLIHLIGIVLICVAVVGITGHMNYKIAASKMLDQHHSND